MQLPSFFTKHPLVFVCCQHQLLQEQLNTSGILLNASQKILTNLKRFLKDIAGFVEQKKLQGVKIKNISIASPRYVHFNRRKFLLKANCLERLQIIFYYISTYICIICIIFFIKDWFGIAPLLKSMKLIKNARF